MASTAVQNLKEFAIFLEVLASENVKSYLEIGSKWGGSLQLVAKVLPKGSRIVSVDLPWGTKATQPVLEETVRKLKNDGFDAHLILGDSTNRLVIDKVLALAPFDACFIDANHTLPYVTQDWQNYGSLSRIVAFHDINFHRDEPMPPGKLPIDVPQLWNNIKDHYPSKEIKLDKQDNGIGILWLSEK